ncbi:MAG: PAS domain-containing protein [Burkholderiaceae bacterium]|nr:PAS domain-containing protein [Burkholderiaceae bacterium]
MRRNLPVTQQEHPFPEGSTLMSTTDPKGRILYTNEAFVAISGFSRDELVGKAHNIVRHPDMPPEAFADLWSTMKAGRSWTALVKNRRKNGDHYWVRANSTPVRRDGETVAYLSVRTAPGRGEIDRAEAFYAALRAGKAGRRGLREGIVVRTGWLAWMNTLRVMPMRWRIRSVALGAALLPGAVAVAAGVPGPALGALAAALALAGAAACALLEWQIAVPLTKILRQAQTLASGQAGEDLHFDRVDEMGRLLRAVNQSGLNLQAMADEVSEQIAGIERVSREIAQGNGELRARTEAASASLVETAASMEEISGTVRATAENARQASETADCATRAADQGGEVVGGVVDCMAQISQSSRRIADIIGVIDGIAFQTNILALNAAVEAARAGEQGRGFAVVAAEVRSLAQRSADAAREIKTLIARSSQTVDAGAERVQQAGRAMQEIVAEVKRVAALSAEITVAAQEQSTGIDQVNLAVVQLDQATQQNATMVDQSAAAAESLHERVEQLAETVSLFRLSRPGGRGVDARAGAARRRAGAATTKSSADVAVAVGTAAGQWDGRERRGPDRARNVTRPHFGAKPGSSSDARPPASEDRAAKVEAMATGTDDWERF